MNGFLPRTLIEAASFADPTFVGGATDIMPLIRNEVRDDENLILLKNIPELKELRDTPEHIVIGSGVRLAELARSELINTRCAAVAQAAAVTASPQIRNIATIGGNVMQDRRCIYFNQSEQWRGALPLCYKPGGEVCQQLPNSPVCRAIYYSDLATALIALDAEAEYLEQGELRRTSVQELVQRHSACNGRSCHARLKILIIRFLIPHLAPGARCGFYKYAMRATIDFPLINFALRCGAGEARAVAGAVAPHPVVLEQTARLLDTQAADEEITAACEAELKKLEMPIREACISPALKRQLYRHISFLLYLRRQEPDGAADSSDL